MRLLFVLTLITPMLSFAQTREDRAKLSYEYESEILDKAVGWSYDSIIGEWVSFNNFITLNKKFVKDFNILTDGNIASGVSQNFLSIRTKAIRFIDDIYYVLIIEKWNGGYEYPSIRQGRYSFITTYGYIFPKKEFSKLNTVDKYIELKTNRIVSVRSNYDELDKLNFLDLIQAEIRSNTSKEQNFQILNTFDNEKPVVRFHLPAWSYPPFPKFNLKHKYFEISPDEFKKILVKI